MSEARSEADRRRMAGAGAIVVAVTIDAFSGRLIHEPAVTCAGCELPGSVIDSIRHYLAELILVHANAGEDLRNIGGSLESTIESWLSGHGGSVEPPVVSVSVTVIPD